MRQKFPTRLIVLRDEQQRMNAIQCIKNLPMDAEKPLEVRVSERKMSRRDEQNALMWAGPLKDISQQVYLNGRTYSPEVWHEHFKREFLPEEFDEELCKDGYEKWTFLPSGDRVLAGSTKNLTVKGFSEYLEQIYAFGAEQGVEFHSVRWL